MTNTNYRGPVNSMGSMEDGTIITTDDGPNYIYQGTLFPNLRTLFNKDGVGSGRVPGYLDNPAMVLVDNIPSSASSTILASASTTVSGTGVTLITVAPGNTTAGTPSIATGIPIIPFGAANPVTVAVALDFGFTTGTTTAASSTVVVVDNTLFTVGQWLCIGGAGNSSKTATQFTQVQTISTTNTTTITVSPSPLGSLTNAPIGAGNLFSQYLPPATQYGPGTPVPNGEGETLAGGMFRIFNPLGAIARNVVVQTTTTAGAGGTFKVSGYDVHAQAMSENIAVTSATTLAFYGKKAFKYIASVVPQFTDATGLYSVGIGDTFGFPMRMDRYEYLTYAWNGINNVNQTGFTKPDLTNPATSSTGDVRGTLQVSTAGAGVPITNATASNGLARLFIQQTIPLWNDITGTPTNTVPFYGVTQS